jgi:hypothetical protein
MNGRGDPNAQAWSHALRAAIAARDEPLYRQRVMEFLVTPEGGAFVQRNLQDKRAHEVMCDSYRHLAPALGLNHPNDLIGWVRDDEAAPRLIAEGATDVVSMFLPYVRYGRDWARAANADVSVGIALACLFFEPVLGLCEQEPQTQDAAASVRKVAVPVQHFAQRA